jgi:hypothetical protein
MKLKLAFVLFFIVSSNIVFAQSFKLKSNPYYGNEPEVLTEKTGTPGSPSPIQFGDLDDDLYKSNDTTYITLNSISYVKNRLKAKTLQNDIDTLHAKIFRATDILVEKKFRDTLSLKLKELSKLTDQTDSLNNEYVKDCLNIKPAVFGFWNKDSGALYELLHDDTTTSRFSLLNNTGLNIGKNTGSIFTEFVSGQLYIFRVSIGAMIASSSTNDSIEQATQEQAIQRLATYGGNTVLKLEYPLLYAHTPDNQGALLSQLVIKGAADFPEFGTTSEKWAGSLSLGINIHGEVTTSNRKIRFFGDLEYSKYFGTDTFRENLIISNNQFSYGQIKLGLVFNDNICLSFILPTFSSEKVLREANVIAGGQILH